MGTKSTRVGANVERKFYVALSGGPYAMVHSDSVVYASSAYSNGLPSVDRANVFRYKRAVSQGGAEFRVFMKNVTNTEYLP